MDEVDIRMKKAKAELDELTLAECRGELMTVYQCEVELTHLAQVTKQRILNVPARLGPKLQDCSAIEIKALLSASLKDALSELVRKRPHYVDSGTQSPNAEELRPGSGSRSSSKRGKK